MVRVFIFTIQKMYVNCLSIIFCAFKPHKTIIILKRKIHNICRWATHLIFLFRKNMPQIQKAQKRSSYKVKYTPYYLIICMSRLSTVTGGLKKMHTLVASILVDLKEKESERELRPDSVCNQELKKMQLGRELLTVTKKKAPNAICVSRLSTGASDGT